MAIQPGPVASQSLNMVLPHTPVERPGYFRRFTKAASEPYPHFHTADGDYESDSKN